MTGGQDLKTQMAVEAHGDTHMKKVIQEKVVQTDSPGGSPQGSSCESFTCHE